MNRTAAFVSLLLPAILIFWLLREGERGTFDFIERPFLTWLASDTVSGAPLPPMTLVLFDDEAAQLAGAGRMGMLDGALFARAAWRLGAVAAGMEGLQGEPRRMIEAAGALPVFGGYDWSSPPGSGWTPLRGEAGARWSEVPGLAGRAGRFARGFMALPVGSGGSREVVLAGRIADKPAPSFLVLAWAASQQWRWSEVAAEPRGFRGPEGRLTVDRAGRARYFPEPVPVLTMGELLMVAEKFDREGGERPFRGQLLVLARATSDVPRVAGEGMAAVTTAELWAEAWEAVRHHRIFLGAGWWYFPVLYGACVLLVFGPARRSWHGAVVAAVFGVLVFALVALGVFGSSRVLLPAGPTILALVAALLFGRAAHRAGWLGK